MRKQKSKWKQNLFIIGALTPALLLSLGIVIYPIINTIIRSFKEPGTGAWSLCNYTFLFTDKVASASIWYTVEVAIATVVLSIALSYLLALFLRFSHSKIAHWIGNLYLIPRFIPGLVAVYAMMTIVRDSGLLHRISKIGRASCRERV